MSDLLPVEPAPGAAEAEVGSSPAGFGYAMAQARVRSGLSIEQAAARMRLSAKQLRALEAEDLEALPAAAYVNGFVRNYARELGMDARPLIDDLNAKLKLRGLVDHAPDLGPGGAAHGRILDDRGWRHLVLAGIVAALICAGLIGVWMTQPASQTRGQSAVAVQGAPRPSTSQAPVAAPTAVAPNRPVAVSAGPQDTGARGSETAASGTGAATAPAPLPEEAHAPIVVAADASSPPAIVAAEAPAAPPDAPSAGLVLRFNNRSWVQVSRPDGRVLLSRNDEAGSMELLNASAPLVVIIGRADAVQVEFRGQPVDLKPYSNSQGVARLTLGDAHGNSGGQSSR